MAKNKQTKWTDILKCLQDDRYRDFVIGEYKKRGFAPEDFRKIEAREIIVDLLINLHDLMEYELLDNFSARSSAAKHAHIENMRQILTVKRTLENELDR